MILIVVLFGIGTDYILFFLFRYRERLREGDESKAAVAHAVERAGEAIASAGGAVIVSFMALVLSSLGIFKSIGPALAIAVFVTVLAALTLVPAVVALLRHQGASGPRSPGRRSPRPLGSRRSAGRWAGTRCGTPWRPAACSPCSRCSRSASTPTSTSATPAPRPTSSPRSRSRRCRRASRPAPPTRRRCSSPPTTGRRSTRPSSPSFAAGRSARPTGSPRSLPPYPTPTATPRCSTSSSPRTRPRTRRWPP